MGNKPMGAMVLHQDQFPQMVCDTCRQISSTKHYSGQGKNCSTSVGHPSNAMAAGQKPTGAKSNGVALGSIPVGGM